MAQSWERISLRQGTHDTEKLKESTSVSVKAFSFVAGSVALLHLIQWGNKELIAHLGNISDYSYKELKGCYH